jgi:Mn2+/Fe2+ NRAMP family transporter
MRLKEIYHMVGPGIVVAATGLGGGDIVAASAAGANYGASLLWAVIIGSVLKFCLTEGIGRWQLVTGRTLLEGWIDDMPKIVPIYFGIYLLIWTFMVAAAMMTTSGLVAYAFFPVLSVAQWSAIQGLLAFILVWNGGYFFLETLMKIFIGLMFVCILFCAFMVMPPASEVLRGIFSPRLPEGSMVFVFGVIGGVGGSATILSYSYWMKEAGWQTTDNMSAMRVDLGTAYVLTGIFGLAIMLVAAGVDVEDVTGSGIALAIADQLVPVLGETGKWIFLFGFWGAAISSLIGVWHGVPYMFANFYYHLKDQKNLLETPESISKSPAYRGYLVYLCFMPMLLLTWGRPVWVVIFYAVLGAFFMPLVAALLLVMNSSKKWLGDYANSWLTKSLLTVCLILFSFLLFVEVRQQFFT